MEPRTKQTLQGEALWSYALKLLGGRAHSSGELREKLRRRAARLGEVDDVLARLKDHGYLNDQRFAESYAASRLANDKFGRMRVVQDLRQRRVAPVVADRAARQVYQDVNEEALIEEWVRRKYRLAPREHLFHEDKDLAAAYRRLLRAGFRTGDIVRVLKRFAKNPDLLDTFEPPEEPAEE